MPAGNTPLSVDRLREAVRAAVAARTLGSVSRDIGVTPMGIKYFLGGGEPRPSTRRKLESWYVLEMAKRPEGSDGEVEAAALTILLRDLPEPYRTGSIEPAVAWLEGTYEAAGTPPPNWLRALRSRLERGDPQP